MIAECPICRKEIHVLDGFTFMPENEYRNLNSNMDLKNEIIADLRKDFMDLWDKAEAEVESHARDWASSTHIAFKECPCDLCVYVRARRKEGI